MKYLITGGDGQIGQDIKKELLQRGETNILSLDIEQMDVTDKKIVDKWILAECPDVIFHCASWNHVDSAEDRTELCYQINVEGTEHVVEAASKVEAKVIFLSSDYVFDGKKEDPYEITDIPNPRNVFGKTKFQAERIVRAYPKHFIVRVSRLFGCYGKNFAKTMIQLGALSKEIKVVKDQISSPTYTVDIAKLLVDMSETEEYGTYHANNEGYCSWAEYASYIFKSNNMETKVIPITAKEFHAKAKRPHNSRLSKQSLVDHGFELLPDWQDAVDRFLIELKETTE